MVHEIECEGTIYYFKLTRRAYHRWEQASGKTRNDLHTLSTKEDMQLTLEGLREGHMLSGATQGFDLNLDKLFELDARTDLTDKIADVIIADKKKLLTSKVEESQAT